MAGSRRPGSQGRALHIGRFLEADRIGEIYEDEDGNHEDRRRFFARGYSVFNQAQVDGYVTEPAAQLSEVERIGRAEAFYANLGITTVYGGDEACYLPTNDTVYMPAVRVLSRRGSPLRHPLS